MAIVGRSELQDAIKRVIGDRTDDDTIRLLEDVTDTLNDYDTRLNGSEDWKTKYEQNDAEWRRRYTDRFSNGDGAPNGTSPDENLEGGEIQHIEVEDTKESTDVTWSDLFE